MVLGGLGGTTEVVPFLRVFTVNFSARVRAGVSFAPLGLALVCRCVPQLALWAAFLRRFAAFRANFPKQ